MGKIFSGHVYLRFSVLPVLECSHFLYKLETSPLSLYLIRFSKSLCFLTYSRIPMTHIFCYRWCLKDPEHRFCFLCFFILFYLNMVFYSIWTALSSSWRCGHREVCLGTKGDNNDHPLSPTAYKGKQPSITWVWPWPNKYVLTRARRPHPVLPGLLTTCIGTYIC